MQIARESDAISRLRWSEEERRVHCSNGSDAHEIEGLNQ